MGCSDPPSSCADYVQKASKSQGVDKVFLAILLKTYQKPAYAREFSQLSLNHPALYEVGFDDFVSQCEKQKLAMPGSVRAAGWDCPRIERCKSKNSNSESPCMTMN